MPSINRRDLLNKLLAIEPGIVKSDRSQSNCVVMRRGRFYSMSREIACSIVSGLPLDMEGALEADRIIELLKQLPEEDVEVSVKDNIFRLKGQGRSLRMAMQDEILLPVDEVERPKTWIRLKETFGEAVELVCPCTKRKGDTFVVQCVHIHPDWLEASDDVCMLRYPIKTFVKDSVLVRGRSLKAMGQLGMTLGAETSNWIHFKNPMGLRMSMQRFLVESYPPLEQFLNLRGKRIIFPKGLAEASSRAERFCDEKGLCISVSEGNVLVEGRDGLSEYSEKRKIKYSGDPLSFSVPPKLMAGVLAKSSECEITEVSMRVNGGTFVYCASLKE